MDKSRNQILKSKENIPSHIRGYVVREKIGSGAFSVVYRVYSPRYDQTFVAKVITIPFEKAHRYISCFESEVKSLISLNHPNVIKLYNFFRENNQLYLIFEDCPYGNLMEMLHTFHKVSGLRLLKMAKMLLEALNECHKNSIAHRDIKTANILLDKYKRPILADFGLASQIKEGEKLDNNVGSLAYKAPELFGDLPYCPFKTDIWSLGVVFYEMATGRLPWENTSNLTLLKKSIIHCAYTIPYDMDPNFGNMIIHMLNLNPEKRPSPQTLLENPIFENVDSNMISNVPAFPKLKKTIFIDFSHKLLKPNRGVQGRKLSTSRINPLRYDIKF